MKIEVTDDDGTVWDVTETVQSVWDNLVQSMNWGSGFMDTAEVLNAMRLAVICGWVHDEDSNATTVQIGIENDIGTRGLLKPIHTELLAELKQMPGQHHGRSRKPPAKPFDRARVLAIYDQMLRGLSDG